MPFLFLGTIALPSHYHGEFANYSHICLPQTFIWTSYLSIRIFIFFILPSHLVILPSEEEEDEDYIEEPQMRTIG